MSFGLGKNPDSEESDDSESDHDVPKRPMVQRLTRYDPGLGSWHQRLDNPALIHALTSHIKQKLGRNMSSQDRDSMTRFIRTINYVPFQHMSDRELAKALAFEFVKATHKSRTYHPDVHEILRDEIEFEGEDEQARTRFDRVNTKLSKMDPRIPATQILSFMGHQSPYDILNLFNPKALICKQHLALDTFMSNSQNPWSWDIIYDFQRRPGAANLIATIKDIVSVEILPIRLPALQTNTGSPFKRIELLIQEWKTQAYVKSAPGKAYHFVFETSDDSGYLKLAPLGGQDAGGKYQFDKRITRLDQMTFLFMDPLADIVFYPDRSACAITSYASPTQITTDTGLTLTTGDYVTFSGFTSSDPTTDNAIITALNNTRYAVTVSSATVFTIAVNTSAVTALSGLKFQCYVEKRRFFVNMIINYVAPEKNEP
jgi:hypothetical protein